MRFLDSSGATMPYSVTQRWLGSERQGPVLVDARHPTSFPLAKYRCDTMQPSYDAAVVVTLPNGAGTLTANVPRSAGGLPFCPRDEGDQRVHEGTIGSWQVHSQQQPSHRVAVSMHSSFAPYGLPSWGRADLDGDGSPDTVIVRRGGRVTARIGSRVVRARADGGPTDRLQGFADLTGDGRPEILVAETSVGCDGGYRLCDSRPTVLTLRAGKLRVVHFPNGEPDFDLGVGDLTTGWVCGPSGLIGIHLLLTGANGYRLVRTTYRVSGLVVRRVSRTTTAGRLSDVDFDALTATRCSGLTAIGWAWERPQGSRPMT